MHHETTKEIKNMANKKFTSNKIPEIVYEVIDEGWMDKDTYVIVFNDMTDSDGDVFHLEVEFHEDEDRVTYTRVYDNENVEASQFVSPCFKPQIEEYILQQVGKINKDCFINEQTINVGLTLEIPKGTTIGELHEFIKSLKVEVIHTKTPRDEKIKILSIENKGNNYNNK